MKPRDIAWIIVAGLAAFVLFLLLPGCKKVVSTPQPPVPPVTVVKPAPTPVPTPAGWIQVQSDRWQRAKVRPEKAHFIAAIVAQIKRNQARYEEVERKTGVPWTVVAALHYREADMSFRCNLAQGDPLTSYSRHVPAGRPKVGHPPPFSWAEAAVDALRFDGLDKKSWNGMGNVLENCEKFNGFGYRALGLISPYDYSWTNLYARGKFVADHKFSSTAIDAQAGCAAIFKALNERQ